MQPCDPKAETLTVSKNRGFITRWNKRTPILTAGCQVADHIDEGPIQLLYDEQDYRLKTVFKLLDAQLLVRRVRPNPSILIAHNSTLSKGSPAHYNLTRVELKTFPFFAGSKSLSIDNAVLGPTPKRFLFTIFKNTDFIESLESNPYRFQHYDISDFSLFVNGKQFPNEGLELGMDHEKTSVMGYRTLFEASGIHRSNSGLQITLYVYKRLFIITL